MFPNPAVARYDGHGDLDSASSFRHGQPLYNGPVPAWAGSSWFSGGPGTR